MSLQLMFNSKQIISTVKPPEDTKSNEQKSQNSRNRRRSYTSLNNLDILEESENSSSSSSEHVVISTPEIDNMLGQNKDEQKPNKS